ncbi:MAG: hypothetical protein IPJ01_10300 [Micavibrio sp.]|nr:hypothetical protein [Micavibrio sp.]
MKKPEEIKNLAKEYSKIKYGEGYYPDVEKAFIESYNQCQQYMSDEIRRWRGAVEAQEIRCKSLRDIIESNADKKYTQEDMVKDIVNAVERTYRYVDNEGWSLDYIKKEIIQSLNKKD